MGIHFSDEMYRAEIDSSKIKQTYMKKYPKPDYPRYMSKEGYTLFNKFLKEKVRPFRQKHKHLMRDCKTKEEAEANLKKLREVTPVSWRKWLRVSEFFYMGF